MNDDGLPRCQFAAVEDERLEKLVKLGLRDRGSGVNFERCMKRLNSSISSFF